MADWRQRNQQRGGTFLAACCWVVVVVVLVQGAERRTDARDGEVSPPAPGMRVWVRVN